MYPECAAGSEARREGWGGAPFGIDWGGSLWFAGQRMSLTISNRAPVLPVGAYRRPRRVIMHRYFRLCCIWARRLPVGSNCTRPGGARHLEALERIWFQAVRGQSSIGFGGGQLSTALPMPDIHTHFRYFLLITLKMEDSVTNIHLFQIELAEMR